MSNYKVNTRKVQYFVDMGTFHVDHIFIPSQLPTWPIFYMKAYQDETQCQFAGVHL